MTATPDTTAPPGLGGASSPSAPPGAPSPTAAPANFGTARMVLWLCALTAACLLPFVNKAFYIDDPLFILAAKQIRAHPADFYGFSVNWYGTPQAMSAITKNPPLASYYLAAIGALAGWQEWVLHLSFLLWSLGTVVGTFFLAREFCGRPGLAALVTLAAPAFLVCSTSVMCDVPMLCLWIWAAWLWVQGVRENCTRRMAVAGILMAACALTKYFGMSLVPLLAAYALFKRRRLGSWLFLLLIPLAALGLYQWFTHHLYGRGLLLDAAQYASGKRAKYGSGFFFELIFGLGFSGGCLVPVLLYAPWMWSKRLLAALATTAALLLVPAVAKHALGKFPLTGETGYQWQVVLQAWIFLLAGLTVLALAMADFWKRRDAESFLLAGWLIGAFIFAGAVNWTVNGRSILPMVPAAAILLVRRLESCGGFKANPARKLWLAPAVAALLVAGLAAWTDCRQADTQRREAREISTSLAGHPLWFQGHWGFQYYLEQAGAKPIDFSGSEFAPGDIILTPSLGTNLRSLPRAVVVRDQLKSATWFGLSTANVDAGAGFYSDWMGPLPYAWVWEQEEHVSIAQVVQPFRYANSGKK